MSIWIKNNSILDSTVKIGLIHLNTFLLENIFNILISITKLHLLQLEKWVRDELSSC